MDKIPFSVYDFFGYLTAGFLVLAGLVAAFSGDDQLNDNPGAIVAVLLIVVAYVVGQIVANVSGFLLESKLVGKLLGRPTRNLFGRGSSRFQRLFPGYYQALPPETQRRVLVRAQEKAGITEPGEGLFFHCHARVKKEQVVLERLNTFLNLYGFCRKRLHGARDRGARARARGDHRQRGHGRDWAWLVGGWRDRRCGRDVLPLLKFFRQYGQELYTSYAELD